MFGYVCFYNGQRVEVYANTTYEAQQKVATQLKVKPKNQWKISVMLAERPDGTEVAHSTASI